MPLYPIGNGFATEIHAQSHFLPWAPCVETAHMDREYEIMENILRKLQKLGCHFGGDTLK